MTLILALANSEQTIQLSDRRLTPISGGSVQTEEANKAGVFICRGARMAYGFAGLATLGSFKTREWLASVLYDCCPPDYAFHQIMKRVEQRVNNDFANHPSLRYTADSIKEISVLFTGYLHCESPPRAFFFILSNAADFRAMADWPNGKFIFVPSREKRPPYDPNFTLVQRVGWWPAMNEHDERSLRGMLEPRKPADAIVEKGVELIREMADRQTASGKIGKQISSIVIPRDPEAPYYSRYHTTRLRCRASIPDTVIGISDTEHEIRLGRSVEAVEEGMPVEVPKVGGRRPCPCGSGRKYRQCHGKPVQAMPV